MAFITLMQGLLRGDKSISCKRDSSGLILALLVLPSYFYFLFHLPVENPLSVDTGSYLNFSPSRTIGYPIFLEIVKYVMGGVKKAIYIQWTFYCFSSFLLAYYLMRITRSLVVGVACLIGLVYHPELIKSSFELMTESLFMAFLMLASIFVMEYLKHKKISSLVVFGGLVGLLILIRPSAYGILIGTLGFFFTYKIPLKRWGAALLPTLFFLAIGSLMQFMQHGFLSTQSFLGHNLFGKVAFIVDDTIHSPDPHQEYILQQMAKEMRPVQKALMHIDDLQFYYMLATPFYDYLRYPVLAKLTHESKYLAALKDPDPFYKAVALTVIKQKPVAYIKDVLLHYGALWFLLNLKTTTKKEMYNQTASRIQSNLPYESAKFVPFAGREKNSYFNIFVYGARVFLSFSFGASLWFLGRGLKRRFSKREEDDLLLGIGLFAAYSIHASFLIIAAVQAGYVRYAFALWPLLFIIFLSSLAYFKQRIVDADATATV